METKFTDGELATLSGEDWAELLSNQPQFADKCPWEKLEGFDWAELLSAQPQFADQCPQEKLDDLAWTILLHDQPQFAKFRKS